MKQLSAMIPETDEEKRNHSVSHNFVTMDGRITEAGEALVGVAFEVLKKACFRNSDAHGWYEWLGTDDHPKAELVQRNFGEVCMLFTSEIAEAFEAFRDGDDPTKIKYKHSVDYEIEILTDTPTFQDGNMTEPSLGKPEGIASELADVFIRIFDASEAMGIPLTEALIRKHHYNFTRPYRHGGKLA